MFKVEKIDYNQVNALSFKDMAYISQAEFLKPFYSYAPDMGSFDRAIQDRQKKPVDRGLLVNSLSERYATIGATPLQLRNIDNLANENTFTIVTAHQPSLMGGPLYYVLKIASAINLCRHLSSEYPKYNFVPTFVSGGEDHDFEEVNHTHLFGKTVTWERDAKGPVGRLDLTNLDHTIAQAMDILGDHPIAQKMNAVFQDCLHGAQNYGEFVFRFVNHLFGQYGLLVVNMDNHEMKKSFIPIMTKEILEQTSKPLVNETQELLAKEKFKAQAFPRDINLFYLGNGSRERIEQNGDRYHIVDRNQSFSQEELLRELEEHPENFSPNVITRPLYQEFTLPNLAYIGGGGEIAYWLERKSQFEEFKIFFPMLIRRNSAMIIPKTQLKTIDKLGFTISDTLQNEDLLINNFIARQTDVEISLVTQKMEIQKAYEAIAQKSKQVDPSLAKSVLADMTKQLKNVDQMESRIKRTLKSQQETNVNKIRKIKEKLYPKNGLQERYDNFMPHYMNIGESFFDILIDNLNPMDRRMTIFIQK